MMADGLEVYAIPATQKRCCARQQGDNLPALDIVVRAQRANQKMSILCRRRLFFASRPRRFTLFRAGRCFPSLHVCLATFAFRSNTMLLAHADVIGRER